ncbi:MAG: hypothetical protein AVDCRST_MAG71-636 [uncultured Lysobacter sp.]|uniref:Uncharacterized protein n=1 Tax=uncultured Lysobacter sp. TaxID=271060 RepID=A0A6J4KSD0_9GAMM|nr:MAG: hypothetical protein AVDCRST_MAG71-636 [uncultured Lysobacter sp.]
MSPGGLMDAFRSTFKPTTHAFSSSLRTIASVLAEGTEASMVRCIGRASRR